MVFKMTTNYLIQCFTILIISKYIFAQVENTPCIINATKQSGVCKEFFECPEADEEAKQGNTPQICGYTYYNNIIVCCPTKQVYQPNDNTFVNRPIIDESDGNSQQFIFPDELPTYSKSESKCNEYTRELEESGQALALTTDSKPINYTYVKCAYNGVPLIVGGEPAAVGEFPFMAALGYPTSGNEQYAWRCGGTLISDQYVVTAAHCTGRENPIVVRLGDVDLSREDDNSVYADYTISSIIRHPKYQYVSKPRPNDIALIQVDGKIKFTQFIRPACLNTKEDFQQTQAIATGYGATSFGGSSSDKLLKVSLNIYNQDGCQGTYRQEYIPSKMICAGEKAGGKDACQGDSGGPLVITPEGNKCKYYLIGVTSFGKSCGVVPGIYTKVSEYIDWIENIVWP